SAIFAALHIRFQIVAEERDLQLQRARLWPFRNERAVDFVVVAQRHSQRSNFFGLHMRQVVVEPTAPFLAVYDKSRRVNGIATPGRHIPALSRGKLRLRKTISPSKIVPVI